MDFFLWHGLKKYEYGLWRLNFYFQQEIKNIILYVQEVMTHFIYKHTI